MTFAANQALSRAIILEAAERRDEKPDATYYRKRNRERGDVYEDYKREVQQRHNEKKCPAKARRMEEKYKDVIKK
jgi:hypothetical protein